MPEYRRAFLRGGTYFFTVVTYNRLPIFSAKPSVHLLNWCFDQTTGILPFKIEALVILPDHLHTIWTLPDNDSDFSTRWKLIKGTFSKHYAGIRTKDTPESMTRKGEKAIWQRRFWEHVIRSEEDFERHCDYIHHNPVKHGFVKSPIEWENSTFEDFVGRGLYPPEWGGEIGKEIADLNFE
jgi:putative transposase